MLLMKQMDQFVEVIKKLRSPNGCPWDQKQTFQTLTPFIVEEAYELVDAIQHHTPVEIQEELGDVLLQVVLHSVIAEEQNLFSIESVIQTVQDKMIRRHPHVFSDTQVKGVEEVWANWEKIKKTEKQSGNELVSAMDSVPITLPALMEASKLQKKASRLGFDWPDIKGPVEKLTEELAEIQVELNKEPIHPEQLTEEIGDLLFSIVNVCRKLDVNPEEALKKSNRKFKDRFKWIESALHHESKPMADMTLDELDRYWNAAKEHLKASSSPSV